MAQLLSSTLTGNQQVPTTTSTATGTSTLRLAPLGNTLRYSLTVSGLDFGDVFGGNSQTPGNLDDVTQVNIRLGARGTNGTVALSLYNANAGTGQDADLRIIQNNNGSVTLRGVWDNKDESSVPLSQVVRALRDSSPGDDVNLYWNVQTQGFPSGEIRGQIKASLLQTSAPVTLAANLNQAQVVEPSGVSAKGESTLVLNRTGDALRYELTVSGLDFGALVGQAPQTSRTGDDVSFIRLHAGNQGQNGAVAFTVYNPLLAGGSNDRDLRIRLNQDDSATLNGVWDERDTANIRLSNFVETLRDSRTGDDLPLYWSVTTSGSPGGAIRGQLNAVPNEFIGTAQNDVLTGTSRDDILRGLNGNDTLSGLGGRDELSGGKGNDRLVAGSIADTFRGAGGFDTADFSSLVSSVVANLNTQRLTFRGGIRSSVSQPFRSVEGLVGTPGADQLTGNAKNNQLQGGAGADRLIGLGGRDRLAGGEGNDRLDGRDGSDRLEGGRGRDTLLGGAGRNILIGGDGKDFFAISRIKDEFNIVKDFTDRLDRIRLLGNLSFGDLRIQQRRNDTVIAIGQQEVMRLEGIQAGDITRADII